MAKWVCTSCGEEAEGVNPPKKCSSCGANKDKFEIMEEREHHEPGEPVEGEDDEWEEECEPDDDAE